MAKIGIKYFELEYFSAFQAGITDNEDYPGFAFFYVQRYLHIYSIPVVSLGCMWVMIKRSEYYQVPLEFKQQLSTIRLKTKPRWYANLGILVVLTTALGNLVLSAF
jgi:hypothetical protein